MNEKKIPLKLKTLTIAICLAFTASAYARNDHDAENSRNEHRGRHHAENSRNEHRGRHHAENSRNEHSGRHHAENSRNEHRGRHHAENSRNEHRGRHHAENSRNEHRNRHHAENSRHDQYNDNSTANNSENEIRSYLTAVDEPLARGEVKLEQRTSKTEFSAEVTIPVPSAALGIANNADATAATLFLNLMDNSGAAFAECQLDLNRIKTNRSSSSVNAEYKVKITDRKGFLQERYGVCDIDLTTAGIQSGVPAIQAGDTTEVTIDTNNAIVGMGNF